MDFNLDPDAEAMRAATREAVDALLKLEPQYHETGIVPEQVEHMLREMGFYGMAIPEDYGGSPVDHLTSVAVQLELARLPPQFWPFVARRIGPGVHIIVEHGSEAIKKKWLPNIAERRLAQLHRDHRAPCRLGRGEDGDHGGARRRALRAQRQQDLHLNANHAHSITVLASTDRKAGKYGISAFLLDTEDARLRGYAHDADDGLDGRQPVRDRLHRLPHPGGEPARRGKARPALRDVGPERGPSQRRLPGPGAGEIALEQTIEHAKTRITFGQALAEHQAIQHMIADMAMDLHAACMVLFEAVWRAMRGEEARMKASMVKVICTEAACRIADKALQIFGGSGYCRGTIVERVYRDLRVLRIYEGASEIHRNMIAQQLLA